MRVRIRRGPQRLDHCPITFIRMCDRVGRHFFEDRPLVESRRVRSKENFEVQSRILLWITKGRVTNTVEEMRNRTRPSGTSSQMGRRDLRQLGLQFVLRDFACQQRRCQLQSPMPGYTDRGMRRSPTQESSYGNDICYKRISARGRKSVISR